MNYLVKLKTYFIYSIRFELLLLFKKDICGNIIIPRLQAIDSEK